MLSLFAYFASIENAPSSLTDNALARRPAVRNKPEPLIRCGGIVLKQGHGILPREQDGRPLRLAGRREGRHEQETRPRNPLVAALCAGAPGICRRHRRADEGAGGRTACGRAIGRYRRTCPSPVDEPAGRSRPGRQPGGKAGLARRMARRGLSACRSADRTGSPRLGWWRCSRYRACGAT